MGFAFCRFREQTNCKELGSSHYIIHFLDLNVQINVPSMWKHYLKEHRVQPTEEERRVVMQANPEKANGQEFFTRSTNNFPEIKILYVEKTAEGYSHKIGEIVDEEFLNKLESILANTEPLHP